ncbi:hypothetical protein E8E13_005700 [Curvularia kusanoi]|uniref:Uncharacterized protein n=1 Tax=Curvularia kusanoi TaxID=90978 RepID=A0A9P4T8E3_CURKU|nr:hypothetical protein E8E13_005700 [Curvularia kusanoi]
MEGKAIFWWIVLGAGLLAFASWLVIHMHLHGHGCFAGRRKTPDPEQGLELSELPDTRRSSAATLVNNPPRAPNPRSPHPATPNPGTHDPRTSDPGTPGLRTPNLVAEVITEPERTHGKRQPRRFGGKESLKPLRLASGTRDTAGQGIQSARSTRQRGDAGEQDLGTAKWWPRSTM